MINFTAKDALSMIINARFLSQKITGVQRFAIEISRAIKKQNPSAVFVSPRGIIHTDLANELEAVTFGRFGGHVWEQFELPVFLKKNNYPLLLNLSNTAPLFYNRNIVTIHDLAFYHHPEWFSKSFSILYRFLLPRLAKKALHVITVSNYSKNDILSVFGLSTSKVSVVYNGVSEFLDSQNKLHKETSFKKPYLLCVGSLDPRKNLSRLLIAFSKINYDVDLLVVGSKNKIFSNSNIESMVANDSRVKLLGYVTDCQLRNLYAFATVFIYPSLFEGFGIPPIEAQSQGCPVMASNITSLPEVLGSSALLFDPYSVKDIENKMNILLSDEKMQSQFRTYGYKNVTKYNWTHSAKQILQLVQEYT